MFCDNDASDGKRTGSFLALDNLLQKMFSKNLLDDIKSQQDKYKSIIQFWFNCLSKMTIDTAEEVSDALNHFQFTTVKKELLFFLIQCVDSKNCFGAIYFADALNLCCVLSAAINTISHCFWKINEDENFKTCLMNVPENIMAQILSSSNIVHQDDSGIIAPALQREHRLLMFLVEYINLRKDIHVKHSVHLFRSLKLPLLKVNLLELGLKEMAADSEMGSLLKLAELKDDEDIVEKFSNKEVYPAHWKNFRVLSLVHICQTKPYGLWSCRNESDISLFNSCGTTSVWLSGLYLEYNDCNVLSLISTYWSDGSQKTFGKTISLQSSHGFSLKLGERICKIQIRCNIGIESLCFISNFGNRYGPFGCSDSLKDVEVPSSNGFLHGFSCSYGFNDDRVSGIFNLSFQWKMLKNHMPGEPVTLNDLKHGIKTKDSCEEQSNSKWDDDWDGDSAELSDSEDEIELDDSDIDEDDDAAMRRSLTWVKYLIN